MRFNVGLYSREYYIVTGFTTANGSHVFEGLCYLARAMCAYLILLTKKGPESIIRFRLSSLKSVCFVAIYRECSSYITTSLEGYP